jgi:hypothetical protein
MTETMQKILDLARWAPSGDNTQPWRAEVLSDRELILHGYDTRHHCVYDLDGAPSRLAHGAFIETMDVAASAHGLAVEVAQDPTDDETHLKYRVRLVDAPGRALSSLYPFVEKRTTQRRPMRAGGLTADVRAKLEQVMTAAGGQVLWFDSFDKRLSFARMLYRSAWIRLVMKEAYEVHRAVIEWNARYSVDRIPQGAVGVDPMVGAIMRWTMQDWRRVEFMNRWFGGTVMPRIQLDFLPSLLCASHFVLLAPFEFGRVATDADAGRLLQRFWLSVTSQGMLLQPEMTPLIFSRYVDSGLPFTTNAGAVRRAEEIRTTFQSLLPQGGMQRAFFVGRIGYGPAPTSRSLRLELDRLTEVPPTTPV